MPAVRREIVLPVERERAWELITEPAELESWLADEVELEPEEGAPLRVAWTDGEAREGVVEEVERAAADRASAGAATGPRVEWTLDDAPGGTRFVVDERRSPPTAPDRLRGAAAHGARARGRAAAPGVDRRRRRLRRARRPDAPRGHRARSRSEPALTASRLAGELPMTRQAVAKHLARARPRRPRDAAPRGPRDALHAHARRRSARRWPGWPRSARAGTTLARLAARAGADPRPPTS